VRKAFCAIPILLDSFQRTPSRDRERLLHAPR
jgi:hypothetical protein